MFKPLENNISLSEQIVEQIRIQIFSGELKPGEKLPSENELCEIFNVSRTSIREALKILAGLGFIKVRRGLGVFVEEINASYLINQLAPILIQHEDDLFDIFRMRKILETHAAAWAAVNATEIEIKSMEKAIQISENLVKDNRAATENLSEANSNFHMVLAKSTGSKVLFRIMQSLIDILTEARHITIQLPNRYEKSIYGHRKILEAIKNRDSEAAQQAMYKHLSIVEQVTKELAKSKK